MEIISFIKNLLIDSLAGISFRNLPFITLQLISAPLALFLAFKILRTEGDKNFIVLLSLPLTMLFIICFTSVPLSIVAGFIVLAFLLGYTNFDFENKILLVLFSFAAGAGHLILALLTLILLFVYSLFIKKKA